MESYHSNSYDVFWIICHGQFDHYQPHKSFLDLGNNIQTSSFEMSYNDASSTRRILIIDACDGSTINMNNNLFAMGIGPSLVAPDQSLISHNWPISDLAGLTYGLLFANQLSLGESYANAHCKSLNLFYSGKKQVMNHLASSVDNAEVMDRIENGKLQFENFYYWGSLTYME